MKKRIICLALAALMVLSAFTLAGCGEKKAKDKYVVGICQLVQHAALDAATQGFMDALNEALPGKVEFQNKNASGEANNCATIVNGFVSDKVDLIMANATPALTAAVSATKATYILPAIPPRCKSFCYFFRRKQGKGAVSAQLAKLQTRTVHCFRGRERIH